VAALTTGLAPVFAFVAAMMAVYTWFFQWPHRDRVSAEPAGPEGSGSPGELA
jgi:hypothetical protein